LGLSTSASIVRGHGGFIDVRTKLGVGTEFSVYLPISAAQFKNSGVSAEGGNGAIILLVDDEENLRKTIVKILKQKNFRVLSASNGTEGLEIFKAKAHEVDLVITDMMMPEMDGPEFIQELTKIRPDIPIIVTSGLGSQQQKFENIKGQIFELVEKPYEAKTLQAAIERALRSQLIKTI
jgi:DNA-binding NtrC family response regulator